MLTIRMQRTGRKGHAQFRVVVQDSRFHPTSGRVVAYVGSYNPHTKASTLDGEKISSYLSNGAQPSDRVAKLLQKEGIKLPGWVITSAPKSSKVRNPDKRRSTRPAEPVAQEPTAEAAGPAIEAAENETAAETEALTEEKTVEAEEVPAETSPEPEAEAQSAPAQEPKA